MLPMSPVHSLPMSPAQQRRAEVGERGTLASALNRTALQQSGSSHSGRVSQLGLMPDPIRTFRDLIVWQKAMDVAVTVVGLADQLEAAGSPVFANQLHRCAISVPSNIAEGHGRRTRRDYAQFVRVANGSLRELLTQLELVRRCRKKFADSASMILPKADEVARMLNALYTSLQRPPKS